MTNLDKKTDEIPYYCSECGGRIIQNYREAELTCSNCGLVIRTQIFLKGPEWREFDTEQKEKRCRVGDPFTYTIHDYGLATIISEKNRDYLGRVISQKYNSQIYRLRKLDKQYRYTNSSQKSMMKAFTELERLESSINLPISRKIKEEAAILYRKLLEKGLTKGRSIDLIITTILYITCRQNGLPITLKDICQNSKFSEKSINRMYRFICKELKLEILPINPINFISRFASALDVSIEVQKLAIDIINKAIKMGISSGRGQMGLIAGALYIACILKDQHRSQKKIASIVNVTEVTIRNRYKELVKKLNIELP
ncbi:MAG: transcription initiation factor IIB [Candidatus Helarchaeota archaeon]